MTPAVALETLSSALPTFVMGGGVPLVSALLTFDVRIRVQIVVLIII